MLLKDKKSRLGKGLGALIPEYGDAEGTQSELQHLALGDIVSNPNQPRVYFDQEKLQELAESIKSQGVSQPILVRKIGDKYEVVAGERRWRACKMLNLQTLPAIVKDLNDDDAMQIALIENIQREDISAVEEARAYQQLIKKFSYTQEELAGKLGKSRPAISNSLRLLDLNEEVLGKVTAGEISAGHARALLTLPLNEQRVEAMNKIINAGLSVRQTEVMVKKMLTAGVVSSAPETDFFVQHDVIKTTFWSKFAFQGTATKGKLVFSFSGEEEREALLKKLGISDSL